MKQNDNFDITVSLIDNDSEYYLSQFPDIDKEIINDGDYECKNDSTYIYAWSQLRRSLWLKANKKLSHITITKN